MFINLFDIEEPGFTDKLWSTRDNNKEKFISNALVGYSGRMYRIYLINNLENSEVGYTDYQMAKIYIKCLDMGMMQKTLIHELTHAWMFENGHNQVDRDFKFEDVCEITACSFDFIYDALYLFYKNFIDLCKKSANKYNKEKEVM